MELGRGLELGLRFGLGVRKVAKVWPGGMSES